MHLLRVRIRRRVSAVPPPPRVAVVIRDSGRGGGFGAPALSVYDDLDGDRDCGCQRCPRRLSRSALLLFNAAVLSPPVINISSLFTALRGNYASDAAKINEVWTLSRWIVFLISEFLFFSYTFTP